MPAFLTGRKLKSGGLAEILVRPTPGRLGFALRMGLICSLITFVAEFYQLSSLATTVYAAFFLLRPTRGSTILASIVMPVFITVALASTLVLTMAVLDHPLWRVLAMALFSFVVLYLGSASKLKPFAATFAVIVGYVLDMLGSLQVGEIATRALLYAWLIAAIPAATCIVVSLVTGPAARRVLGRALAGRLNLAAAALRSGDVAVVAQLNGALQQGDAGLQELLASARIERALPGSSAAALRCAVASTMAILTCVSLIARIDPHISWTDGRHRIAQTLDEMAVILRSGGYPVAIAASMIASEGPDVPVALHALSNELTSFAQGEVPAPAPSIPGFMVPDAFTNPAHARFALKATMAAMVCYLTFQLLDWPGIHTCLITCYVVSLGSAGETIEKLTLRICGCLVGAALGFVVLVFVLPGVDSIAGLVALIALGTIPAAWVTAGGPRVSYAGLQIAFAYYLVVLQGPSPAFDLSLGRDRIIGIIFGNLMVYVIFTRVWPASICAAIDPALAKLVRLMAAMASDVADNARWQVGPLRNGIAAVSRQLRVARLEPLAIRPTDTWLRDRNDKLAQISAVQAPLLVMALGQGTGRASAAGPLTKLAGQLEHNPSGGNPDWAILNTLIQPREDHHADS